MTIFIKDDLRASVEAATGGLVTVLYTAAGHPSYMNVIPKFNLQDIDVSLGTGVHPAFIVNGAEKSELFIGQHMGCLKDNNLLSFPGAVPQVGANFDAFRGWAANNGPGWHMMTHAEWAAIALWSWKNGTMPRGNNQYGRDIGSPWEVARRVDGDTPGNATGNGRHYTGSGPASWRHNGQASGIADLNGNVWEWMGGLRLNNGEIQMLPNNDGADNSKDQSRTSSLWKAIKASDGTLVAPGTAGTLKYDATTANGTGGNMLSDTVTSRSGNVDEDDNINGTSQTIESMGLKAGLTVPPIAKALCLYPPGAGLGGDTLWMRNHGERMMMGGGRYSDGSLAGVFARYAKSNRQDVYIDVGARPVCVL